MLQTALRESPTGRRPPSRPTSVAVTFELRLAPRREVHVRLVGVLDADLAVRVRERLRRLSAAGFSRVLLDTRELVTDHVGAHLLNEVRAAARREDWSLVIDQCPSGVCATGSHALAGASSVQTQTQTQARLADGRTILIASDPDTIGWVCDPRDPRRHAPDRHVGGAGQLADVIAATLGYERCVPSWVERLAAAIANPRPPHPPPPSRGHTMAGAHRRGQR